MTSHRARRQNILRRWLPSLLVLAAAVAGVVVLTQFHGPRPRLAAPPTTVSPAARFDHPAPPTSRAPSPSPPVTHTQRAAPPSPCRSNAEPQHVIVSVRAQHAWICAGSRRVRDSAVTTGASASGNGTPTGTWHVQAKQADRWLTVRGGDSYHVEYWIPYDGSYGFHDAAWQKFPFGSGQYRTDGSHGCVHFPIAVMKWLYNWTQVGATVTITA